MNQKVKLSKVLTYALIAALVSAIFNAVLFYIGVGIGFMDSTIVVPGANQPITIVPVVISSIIPTIISALVLLGFNLFLNKPLKVFNILALVLLVLSFVNPFLAIPNIPIMMGVWLNLMHVVVAGVVVYVYNKYTLA
jgi:hypothetical protein